LPGNLHFINVVPEDKATYACFAENKISGSIQRGQYITVNTYEGIDIRIDFCI